MRGQRMKPDSSQLRSPEEAFRVVGAQQVKVEGNGVHRPGLSSLAVSWLR